MSQKERIDKGKRSPESKYLECFTREIRELLDNSGAAVVVYHRQRMRMELYLITESLSDHFVLQDRERGAEDSVFSSICQRIGYRPEDFRSFRFEAANGTSGTLLIFAREKLGALGEFIERNLKLCLLYLENAALLEALERNDLELLLLQETGEMLTTSMNLDEVFASIVKALGRLLAFDALGVFILGKEGQAIDEIFSHGYERPNKEQLLAMKAGKGLVGWVIKTGEAAIVPDVAQDPRYVSARSRTRSELVVPLFSGREVIGAFNLESNDRNAFTPAELSMVTAFANQASFLIVRARLFDEAIEKNRIDEELQVARSIQKTFLPDQSPKYPGFDLDAINISSQEVGGDYFDFIPIVESQLGVAIADVSGKGMPASLIMASFRASLIAEIRNNYAIRTIMGKVNNLICESVKRGEFVTAVYGVLDVKNKVFTFSNAGHNPPFVLRKSGRVDMLTEGGLTLGVIEDQTYDERPIYVNSGDIIVFYTDGITEMEDENSEQFGTERLVELVKEHREMSAHNMREKIIGAVLDFKAPSGQRDDLTLVLIKAD